MQLRYLAEVAALSSVHSAHIIESTEPLAEQPLARYWRHSRRRLHCWTQILDAWPARFRSLPKAKQMAAWTQTAAVLEEVFVSEILTRVWTAVLMAAEARESQRGVEPIARHVFAGHQQARHQALELLVRGPMPDESCLLPIDRVRRRAERWTDVLVGHLVLRYDLSEIAFDETCAREFGSSQLAHPAAECDPVRRMLLAGLRLALPEERTVTVQTADANHEIAQSVLAMFPASAFQADGRFQTLWHGRIERSSRRPERAMSMAAAAGALCYSADHNFRVDMPDDGISFLRIRDGFA